VEFRLDAMPEKEDWLECCKAIEATGWPVILTLRLKSEGGHWKGADQERLPFYIEALKHLSAVDVEFQSSIAKEVSAVAKKSGKCCIVSFHDFSQTPSLAKLHEIILAAQSLGSIVKITTMTNSPPEIGRLQSLLDGNWSVPLCVMGMGPLGTPTRILFPVLGSCLTYGYLDKPSAPGQLSAAELVEKFLKISPDYAAEFARHRTGI
jgi:3-dehydroquinate dehydratase-1